MYVYIQLRMYIYNMIMYVYTYTVYTYNIYIYTHIHMCIYEFKKCWDIWPLQTKNFSLITCLLPSVPPMFVPMRNSMRPKVAFCSTQWRLRCQSKSGVGAHTRWLACNSKKSVVTQKDRKSGARPSRLSPKSQAEARHDVASRARYRGRILQIYGAAALGHQSGGHFPLSTYRRLGMEKHSQCMSRSMIWFIVQHLEVKTTGAFSCGSGWQWMGAPPEVQETSGTPRRRRWNPKP